MARPPPGGAAAGFGAATCALPRLMEHGHLGRKGERGRRGPLHDGEALVGALAATQGHACHAGQGLSLDRLEERVDGIVHDKAEVDGEHAAMVHPHKAYPLRGGAKLDVIAIAPGLRHAQAGLHGWRLHLADALELLAHDLAFVA